MELHFEGDLSALNEDTEDVCKKILLENDFNKCTVKVEAVGKKGDNYVANVKRFIAQQDGVNEGKLFKMIVKLAPTLDQVRDLMQTSVAFNNEIIVYNELFPKYDELQEAANVPLEERLRHPRCYGSNIEPPNEVILLEDICESGFKLFDRFLSMSDEHARMVLKELAKIHALSYTLKAKDHEYYLRIKGKLTNMWAETKNFEEMRKFTDQLEIDAISAVKNELYKEKIKGVVANMPDLSIALHHNDFDSDYSAIIQGDCWTNNMMFRNKDEKPLEVMMLDYQLTRIASPAADIFYFIFNCIDHKTRRKYFKEWLDHYYESFDKFLSYFGLEANSVYPRDKLDEDLRANCNTSFGIAVMLSNMLVRESEDVIDFQDHPEALTSPDSFSVNGMRDVIAERFRDRLVGLIETCIEFGYF